MDKDNAASWGMSKAFDMVVHTILLVEVGKYGVIGKELEWFDGYLSGGRQIVLHRVHSRKTKVDDHFQV